MPVSRLSYIFDDTAESMSIVRFAKQCLDDVDQRYYLLVIDLSEL